jgi:hypothetical protein
MAKVANMAKALWHVTMSLDGYIAPRDDSTGWMFGHGDAGALETGMMTRTGAVLSGRRGFDLGNRAAGECGASTAASGAARSSWSATAPRTRPRA